MTSSEHGRQPVAEQRASDPPPPGLSLQVLHPGNFALVMASGIISIGFKTLHFELLGDVLYVFALGAWIVLLALSAGRISVFTQAVRGDLLNPRMVFSYFTLVAATDVVGLLLHARGYPWLALACWVFAFLAWCSLLYLAFSVLSLEPQDISPLLWVIMGAAAISANAGTTLLTEDPRLPFLAAQHAFIDGVTLMIWAWATWWIPMLFLFGVWKHVANRLPLTYEPIMWSFVFPLGMYALASARLGLAAEFQPLQWISQAMIWVAFAAWLVVLAGLVRRVLTGLTNRWAADRGSGSGT